MFLTAKPNEAFLPIYNHKSTRYVYLYIYSIQQMLVSPEKIDNYNISNTSTHVQAPQIKTKLCLG